MPTNCRDSDPPLGGVLYAGGYYTKGGVLYASKYGSPSSPLIARSTS
jgi:hypothetical protein